MPLYDYKCTKCGHIFEIQQKISEDPLKYCPQCKGPIKRLISPAGIIFKGTGFHVTDYGRRPKTEDQRPKTKETKKETKPTEIKNSAEASSRPQSK